MRSGKPRAIAIALLGLVLMLPGVPLPTGPVGIVGEAAGSPLVPEPVPKWADELDDMSRVYIPPGGLQGITVTDGYAGLSPGYSEAWLASTVIRCPDGYRYDLVLIEVDTPGGSRVEVSVLDATRESDVVGFANATIDGLVKLEATDVSVYSVDPGTYPELRIQVNLVADGTDRPRLLSWSLHYIGLEEWRDDFLGPGKLDDVHGVNFTDGSVVLNLSRKSSGTGPFQYEAFPPVLVLGGSNVATINYPNEARTKYDAGVALGYSGSSWGGHVDDLDGDGYPDFLVAMTSGDSHILWGDSSGTWSKDRDTALNTDRAYEVTTGDVNGDGEPDIAFACYDSYGDTSSLVFLNKGDGDFDYDPSITLTNLEYSAVDSGDLNNDGYDDLVFVAVTEAKCYFGGPNGPDASWDIDLPTYLCYKVLVRDLDGDGYQDVALGDKQNTRSQIFLGGENGPDRTPDFSLYTATTTVLDMAAGDVNGDGYVDIVYYGSVIGDYTVHIAEGSEQGWSDSNLHDDIESGYSRAIEVADVDKDGYDDILLAIFSSPSYTFEVYKGGTTWPTTADVSVATGGYFDIAVAIPEGGGGSRMYRGSLETPQITLPEGKKWDMLCLEGITPQNTSVAITVLGSTGEPVANLVDLSGWDVDLSSLGQEPSISVRVDIASEFNWTTPRLDSLTVKWMDERLWKDEFYGRAKIESLLNLDLVDRTVSPRSGPRALQQLITVSSGVDGAGSYPAVRYIDVSEHSTESLVEFEVHGASGVDVADVNGDGLLDLAFSVYGDASDGYKAKSPLFMGHTTGWMRTPGHQFPTEGATDILMEDLNGDGHVDVVVAQERNKTSFGAGSLLFWGKAAGWNKTADVVFGTWGASDVEAVDLNGDGRLDLAFACFKSASTTTDSMVFLQGTDGFSGGAPDHGLPTKGARAVSSGDIDDDGFKDLVFANSFSGGFTEISSYVYWGLGSGGFVTQPAEVPTVGATGVTVSDLDGDGDLDLVFANKQDNNNDKNIASSVYLGSGSRTLPSTPSYLVPTHGAVDVDAVDLDGDGWEDLAFACQGDDASQWTNSTMFMGGPSGWSPALDVPTIGAQGVLLAEVVKEGHGSYLSQPVKLDPLKEGAVNTFRSVTDIGTGVEARASIIDADTWEELASSTLEDGDHTWDLSEAFKLKEHPSLQVMLEVDGLGPSAEFTVYMISFNWTERVLLPPQVRAFDLPEDELLRMRTLTATLDTFDEYDPDRDLSVTVNHRLNGTQGWDWYLVSKYYFEDGTWRVEIFPKADAPTGEYDFRIRVRDTDDMLSQDAIFPNALRIMNNPPSAPSVRILPARPVSTSTLGVDFVSSASDAENAVITYRYLWYRDGQLVTGQTNDSVDPSLTSRGENWSVEVWAFDGEDEGPIARSWTVIQNAAPLIRNHLPDPEMDEDTSDSEWLDLSKAFTDPDDDPLTWSVDPLPEHMEVTIGPDGAVTIVPERDWHGEEEVTFVASDGELQVSQTVTVLVLPVNDPPRIIAVNGEPVTSGPVEFTIMQGDLLIIEMTIIDVEGQSLLYDVNTSAVELDEATGVIRFSPGDDVVGTLRFAFKVADVDAPDAKVSLDFIIHVENENDPMEEPIITHPSDGDSITVNVTFYLSADCFDPDEQFGQELNYTWTSSISGLLGYGSTLTLSMKDPGDHIVILTVSDGEFQKSTSIALIIKPDEVIDPDPGPDPDPVETLSGNRLPSTVLITAVLAVLVVAVAAGYLVMARRVDVDDGTDEPVDMDENEALKRISMMAKEAADTLEETKNGNGGEDPEWEETTEVTDGILIASPGTTGVSLNMEAKVTSKASSEVKALWDDIGTNGTKAPKEDKESLRLDNLKRKYQNAIGRLPYGIPSRHLKDREWTDLAAALATGDKKTVEGDREVTNIDGRWYYSDPEDSGSFLKEHGQRQEERSKPSGDVAKGALLAKLEERFILGEISEEAYKELKDKYS